jgi:cobalamin biosynthesis Mg chelatase CobN
MSETRQLALRLYRALFREIERTQARPLHVFAMQEEVRSLFHEAKSISSRSRIEELISIADYQLSRLEKLPSVASSSQRLH